MQSYLDEIEALSCDMMQVVRDGDNARVEFVFTRGNRDSLVESNEEILQDRLNAAAGDGASLVDVEWRGIGDYGPYQITAHVVRDGKLTRIADATLEVMQALDTYPVLDESDWSDRQSSNIYEAIDEYGGDEALDEWRAGELDVSSLWDVPADLPKPGDVPANLTYAELADTHAALHEFLTQAAYANMSDSGEY